jgi:hypothetical protein
MFEFHLSEFYLRQQEERIASDAERHRITHVDRPDRKRILTKLAGRIRLRLSRRGPVRVSGDIPSLSIVPDSEDHRRPDVSAEDHDVVRLLQETR